MREDSRVATPIIMASVAPILGAIFGAEAFCGRAGDPARDRGGDLGTEDPTWKSS
jgi:hypothetical protein